MHAEWIRLVKQLVYSFKRLPWRIWQTALTFCWRFNRRTLVIETTSWFHSHWSCYYTDDCKNEAVKERSGFDILATTLPLWFMSQSETVMGKATLSVFFRVVPSVCDSATTPTFPLFFFFLTCHFFFSAVLSYQIKCEHLLMAGDVPFKPLASTAILNAFGPQTFDSIACSACLWCTSL